MVVFKDYNGLANRRFQPLSHVSEKFSPRRNSFGIGQVLILSAGQTLSRRFASDRLSIVVRTCA